MRVLFVCSRNRLRSPTAEELFSAYPGLETASAGTSRDAETPVSDDLISWADMIFVMEPTHRRRLNDMFGSLMAKKHVVVLGIPDKYAYMEKALIASLKQKVTPHLKLSELPEG